MISLRTLLATGLAFAGTLGHAQDLEIEIIEEIVLPEPQMSFEGISIGRGATPLASLDQVLAPSANFLVADDQALSPKLASGASVPIIVGNEVFVIADETFDPVQRAQAVALAAPVSGANDSLISAVGQDPWCNLEDTADLAGDLQNWIIGNAHAHLRVPVAAWALCGDLLTFGEQTAAPLQQVLRLESIPLGPNGPGNSTILISALSSEFEGYPKVSAATLATLSAPVGSLPWGPGLSLVETDDGSLVLMEIEQAEVLDVNTPEGAQVGLVTLSVLIPADDQVLMLVVHGGADPAVPFSDLYGSLRAAQDRLTLSTQNLAN